LKHKQYALKGYPFISLLSDLWYSVSLIAAMHSMQRGIG